MRTIDHLKHPLITIACLCMLALTACVCVRLLRDDPIHQEGEATRRFIGQWLTDNLMPEVHAVAAAAAAMPDSAIMEIDHQADRLAIITDNRLASIQREASGKIDQALLLADARLGQAITSADQQITGMRGSLQPAFTDVAAITHRVRLVADENLECRGNGNCWPVGITAALGGAKVALGETGQAMRRIDAAMPKFIETAKRIEENSDVATAKAAEASEETRKVMANLARATKPLPAIVRIPLGVAGAVAPVAAGAIGAAAAMGAFK
jgi:hypothetical protein